MDKAFCKNCAYFRQHFTFDKRKIFRVYCGHCTFEKVRNKKPDATICENFVFKNPDEDSFVSKEYLSKELLQYFMRLELLPQIMDAE